MTAERGCRLLTAALAAAGLAIAGYLSYSHATDTSLICPTSGCDVVRRSSYSVLAGVPVAYLGVAGYALIVATAARRGARAALANVLFAVTGLGFALYLLAVQIWVIDAVCTWCLSSDGLLVAITVISGIRLRAARSGRRAAVRTSPAAAQ